MFLFFFCPSDNQVWRVAAPPLCRRGGGGRRKGKISISVRREREEKRGDGRSSFLFIGKGREKFFSQDAPVPDSHKMLLHKMHRQLKH